jgi:hypothetical protein
MAGGYKTLPYEWLITGGCKTLPYGWLITGGYETLPYRPEPPPAPSAFLDYPNCATMIPVKDSYAVAVRHPAAGVARKRLLVWKKGIEPCHERPIVGRFLKDRC